MGIKFNPLLQNGLEMTNPGGGGGTVTSVTASGPLASSGGNSPNITIQNADATHTGALTSTDWNTFNNKQPAGSYATGTGTANGTNTGDVTLTAVGASPSANAASLSGQVLTLQPFDSTHPGVVTASGGGTSNFLRADGTWAAPTSSGANTALSNLASVAINTSLLPGTDNSIDLGSTTKTFRNANIGVLKASDGNTAIDVNSRILKDSGGGNDMLNWNSSTLIAGGSFNPITNHNLDMGDSTHQWLNIHQRNSLLYGITSGAITLSAADGTTSYSVKWPSAQGASSTALKNDGSGNLSWTSVPTGTGSANGTNTGDITLAAVGSSPNANAASLSGQVLNLQHFNSTNPGVVTASGGGTTNFLRADGTWATPSGGGGANTSLSNLSSVDINTSLLSTSFPDVGSQAFPFSTIWAGEMLTDIIAGKGDGSGLSIQSSGTTQSGASGDLTLDTQNAASGFNSGMIDIHSGNAVSANSGDVKLRSGTGTVRGDAYIDGKIVHLVSSDHITAENKPIKDVSDPSDPQDAATKNYVDSSSGSFNDTHLKSSQSTGPTIVANAGAGTGASASLSNATDIAGQISITTGTIGLSTGSYATVTFNIPYDVAPICVLTPAGSALSSNVYVTSTTTTMTINFALAGGVSTTYLINYHCIQTQ